MNFLDPRRKAVIGLLVPLIGGLLALHPDNAGLQLAAVIVTALGTALGVHQVTNKAPAVPVLGPVLDVLDDVPPTAPPGIG